jgi:pyridoxine 5'-phosphate synthase PdxJ
VTYTGGYELPDEAPPALKQALTLTLREERRHAQIASVAGMRSLAHKESRVNFFDPNAAIAKLGASGSAVPEPVKNLLMHYIRIQV